MQLDIIQVLLGLITFLLGVIAWGGKWGVKVICESINKKVDKEDCEKVHQAIEKENVEVWERVNHHQHNGGGKVIIS